MSVRFVVNISGLRDDAGGEVRMIDDADGSEFQLQNGQGFVRVEIEQEPQAEPPPGARRRGSSSNRYGSEGASRSSGARGKRRSLHSSGTLPASMKGKESCETGEPDAEEGPSYERQMSGCSQLTSGSDRHTVRRSSKRHSGLARSRAGSSKSFPEEEETAPALPPPCQLHHLIPFIAPRRVICNGGCKKWIQRNSQYFICQDCQFDICDICAHESYPDQCGPASPNKGVGMMSRRSSGSPRRAWDDDDSMSMMSTVSRETTRRASRGGGRLSTLITAAPSSPSSGPRPSGSMLEPKVSMKLCNYCKLNNVSFGDKCSICRKGPKSRQCKQCQSFFSGYRDICEDCSGASTSVRI